MYRVVHGLPRTLSLLVVLATLAACDSGGDASVEDSAVKEQADAELPSTACDAGACGLAKLNRCGGTARLEAQPGSTCGVCNDGAWACSGPDAVSCEGASARNDCGKCGALVGESGTACGVCSSGSLQCDALGQLSCKLEREITPNACGGCGALAADPGDACGACGFGHYECATTETLRCAETKAAQQACTDCASVEGMACGLCDQGKIDCATMTCDQPSESPANACGGCAELTGKVGDACGECNHGHLECDGKDAMRCVGDVDKNACGGCQVLDAAPGDVCGTCWLGKYKCGVEGSLFCDGDPGSAAANACGGCSSLTAAPGTTCGPCQKDHWACQGSDRVACSGSTFENACDGCAPLTETLGASCGECGKGSWECSPNGAAQCTSDSGNRCGGCSTLAHQPGDACGPCGRDQYVCNGTEGVVCGGETYGNECKGCAPLSRAVGVTCDGSDLDLCTDDITRCDGTENVTCAQGSDACEGTPCKLEEVRVTADNPDTTWIERSGCNEARHVFIQGESIRDLSFMRHFQKIGSLEIVYTPNLSSLEGLTHLESLRSLTISGTPNLKSLHGLESAAGIRYLTLGSHYEECGELSLCPEATWEGGGLETLAGLAPAETIAVLDIRGQTGLRNLGSGNALRIAGNNFASLHLRSNPLLEDLSGLTFGEAKLSTLVIIGNPKLSAVHVPLKANESDSSPTYEVAIVDNESLGSVSLENLTQSDYIHIQNNPRLTSMRLDVLKLARYSMYIEGTGLSSVGVGPGFRGIYNLTVSDNPALKELDWLVDVTSLGGALTITNNPQLQSLGGLSSLSKVGSSLELEGNGYTSLAGLSELSSVGGRLRLANHPELTSLSGLSRLKSIGRELQILNNPNLPTCLARELARRVQAAGGVGGQVSISGNGAAAVCP